MADYFFLAGLNHLGAIKQQAEFARKIGFKTLILINDDCTTDYTQQADILIKSNNIFDPKTVYKNLKPYASKIAAYTCVQDRLWPSIYPALLRLGFSPRPIVGQLRCRIKPLLRELTRDIMPLKTGTISRSELKNTTKLNQRIANEIGIPCVIKPFWGVGSELVFIIENEENLEPKLKEIFESLSKETRLQSYEFDSRLWDPINNILIEEYIPGIEYTFDGFISDGKIYDFGFTEKGDLVNTGGIIVESSEVYPAADLSSELQASLREDMKKALRLTGLDNSCFHIEFRIDHERSRYAIVEINPRPAGWGVCGVVELVTGINAIETNVRLAAGQEVQKVFSLGKAHAVSVYLSADIKLDIGRTVAKIYGMDWIKRQPEFRYSTGLKEGSKIPPFKGEYYISEIIYLCKDKNRIPTLKSETASRLHADLV